MQESAMLSTGTACAEGANDWVSESASPASRRRALACPGPVVAESLPAQTPVRHADVNEVTGVSVRAGAVGCPVGAELVGSGGGHVMFLPLRMYIAMIPTSVTIFYHFH
jgi:hypothetical protein